MNTAQQAKYRGLVTVTTDPIYRTARCLLCSFRASIRRRGFNALGAAARIRGEVQRHIVAKHPEALR